MNLGSMMPQDTPEDVGRRLRDLERDIAELQAAMQIGADSLGNGLLKDPIVPGVARASASGFGLTPPVSGVIGVLATDTFVVPDRCTRLFGLMFSRLFSRNNRTTGGVDGSGTDALYTGVTVGTAATIATPVGVSGSNGFATVSSNDIFLLTGLTPGDVLSIRLLGCSTVQSLAANAENFAVATASLTWLR